MDIDVRADFRERVGDGGLLCREKGLRRDLREGTTLLALFPGVVNGDDAASLGSLRVVTPDIQRQRRVWAVFRQHVIPPGSGRRLKRGLSLRNLSGEVEIPPSPPDRGVRSQGRSHADATRRRRKRWSRLGDAHRQTGSVNAMGPSSNSCGWASSVDQTTGPVGSQDEGSAWAGRHREQGLGTADGTA